MVTLQFSTTNHPLSRIVCWATWSPFSHVDLLLPDGRVLGSEWDTGVTIRNQRRDYTRIARLTADIPFDAYYDALMTQIGKPYDWSGVIGIMAHKEWQKKNSWFCSELQAWAAEQCGVRLLRRTDVSRVTPRDLLISPLLKPA